MRIVWAVIVVIVIAWTLLNNFMDGLGAGLSIEAALRTVGRADQTASTMLVLIALTLAFWFAAEQKPETTAQSPDPRPARPESDALQLPEDALTQPCRACGKEIHARAVRCPHCGVLQAT